MSYRCFIHLQAEGYGNFGLAGMLITASTPFASTGYRIHIACATKAEVREPLAEVRETLHTDSALEPGSQAASSFLTETSSACVASHSGQPGLGRTNPAMMMAYGTLFHA